LLAIGVFVRHSGSTWLSEYLPISAAGIFYALGGLWEATLCTTLIALLWCLRRTNVFYRLAIAACGIGALEGMQMFACRFAVGGSIGLVPKGANLCDYAVGLPIGHVLLALYFLILCWVMGSKNAK